LVTTQTLEGEAVFRTSRAKLALSARQITPRSEAESCSRTTVPPCDSSARATASATPLEAGSAERSHDPRAASSLGLFGLKARHAGAYTRARMRGASSAAGASSQWRVR